MGFRMIFINYWIEMINNCAITGESRPNSCAEDRLNGIELWRRMPSFIIQSSNRILDKYLINLHRQSGDVQSLEIKTIRNGTFE